MLIEIENTSSPGASFTNNTNNVLIKTYNWIKRHPGLVLQFRDFRSRLQAEESINDNNNRNIYPLLKNGGLVDYSQGKELCVDNFFTSRGKAYVETIEMERLIRDSGDYSDEIKTEALRESKTIREQIIASAIVSILAHDELNYTRPLRDVIEHLIEFRKINKVEYALMLFAKKEHSNNDYLDFIQHSIDDYRDGSLDVVVSVVVRNDHDTREMTNSTHRSEGLSYLTSYTYFMSLLQQAGFIYEKEGYYHINIEDNALLVLLGGIDNV